MRKKILLIITSIRPILHLFGVNRAVLFGVMSKVWFALAGAVTMLLVALYFSPQVQGYYFTFYSLVAMQLLVELGLTTVIINFTSHEWVKLSLNSKGMIEGDINALSRFKSLFIVGMRWYSIGAIIFTVVVGSIGYVFFSHAPQVGINWSLPWLIFCFLGGINFVVLPIFAFLEGSNQISQVYFYRFILEIVRSVAMWICILQGAALWTLSMSLFSAICWSVLYLLANYVNYFKSIIAAKVTIKINWWKEVWPMQWRLAVSWLSGYFFFYLFTPVLFFSHGVVVAGQMGMTFSMANALSIVSSMWIVTRTAQYGMLISKKAYKELDALLFRSAAFAVLVAVLGAIVGFSFIYYINVTNNPFALRFLDPVSTLFFLVSSVLTQISIAQSTYLRAHKKEPFMMLSIISAIIMIVLIFFSGGRWGPIGMAVSYFLVVTFITIPYGTLIWYRCRKEWHANEKIDLSLTIHGEERI
jgi:hypothetical protein